MKISKRKEQKQFGSARGGALSFRGGGSSTFGGGENS